MSKYELEITVDRKNSIYKVGDTVNCSITLTVTKTVSLCQLETHLYWQASGKGDTDRGKELVKKVNSFRPGEYKPGTYNFSHSFVIDHGPFTYQGELFHVNWFLAAQTEREKSCERIITINRGKPYKETSRIYNLDIDDYRSATLNESVDGNIRKVVLISLALLFGLGLIFGGINIESNSQLFIPIIFLLIGTCFIFVFIKMIIADFKLKEVCLTLDSQSYKVNEICEMDFSFKARNMLNIKQILVSLIGNEVSYREHEDCEGSSLLGDTYQFYEYRLPILENCIIKSGESFSDKIKLSIPDDIPPTFTYKYNNIDWIIQVHIKGKNGLNWQTRRDIEILG